MVRGYEGRNALLMLPKYALERLAVYLGDFPITDSVAGHISGEVHRALGQPMPVTKVKPDEVLDRLDASRG